MRQFAYSRAADVDAAIKAKAQNAEIKFLAGGTNLVDLMKMGVERPIQLVDINRLPLNRIEERSGGLRIGATVRNTEAANHELIRTRYPVLSQAILAGASPQLRNLATMGGNLLQRTRCYYFYDPSYTECNKRNPGSGCAAKLSYNRIHAILGASEQCIATHPSDMCVALAALEATVIVQGLKGERSIPMSEFHRLPGTTPQIDTNLHAGELITAIDLPAMPYAKRSHYLKIRDRRSYAFALVSVAVVVDLDNSGTIRQAKIALGGVAHKPWRSERAEHLLVGKKANDAAFQEAAKVIVEGAKPYKDNAFKVELARRSVVRALTTVTSAA